MLSTVLAEFDTPSKSIVRSCRELDNMATRHVGDLIAKPIVQTDVAQINTCKAILTVTLKPSKGLTRADV